MSKRKERNVDNYSVVGAQATTYKTGGSLDDDVTADIYGSLSNSGHDFSRVRVAENAAVTDSIKARVAEDAKKYKQYGKEGARKKFFDCNQSVEEITKSMGHKLNGAANAQIEYMRSHWIKLDSMEQAKELADSGVLVVAGTYNKKGHGHVMAIVPGSGDKRGVPYGYERIFPNIAGGSNKYKEEDGIPKETVGHPYSEGGRTIRDAVKPTKEDLDAIEYFTPVEIDAAGNQPSE